MKTVLFISGFGEVLSTRDYGSVLGAIESAGYRATFVPINWHRTTIDDWVTQVAQKYAAHDPAQTVLAGFSFGAITALLAATRRPPAALLLCSLSPFFAEDLPKISPSWQARLGKRRFQAFSRHTFLAVAAQITVPTTVFVGQKEVASVIRRCQKAARQIAGAQLVTVPDATHDVSHPNYRVAMYYALNRGL